MRAGPKRRWVRYSLKRATHLGGTRDSHEEEFQRHCRLSPQRKNISWITNDADCIVHQPSRAESSRFDAVAHPPYFQVQVNEAR
jgi:hypothetical protein